MHEYLLIDKPAKDFVNAIANSFSAFAKDITHSISSVDKELFKLKLTHSNE
jgi:hypothetical protein